MTMKLSTQNVEPILTKAHACLSAASSYRGIGILPALIKLVCSVAQVAIGIGFAIITFGNKGVTPYIDQGGKEACQAIRLCIRAVKGGDERFYTGRKYVSDHSFKDRVKHYSVN